ncbi:hypothetical protein BSPWISOXPB_6123 [uncultured Gammaproteobacteria bacterium]|nr:hypothetical protein BSPWISOXPB_6123 [uncultured Gammaproteobacteria bacterium]
MAIHITLFRPHSDFWYLTGFKEPETVAGFFQKTLYDFLARKKSSTRDLGW